MDLALITRFRVCNIPMSSRSGPYPNHTGMVHVFVPWNTVPHPFQIYPLNFKREHSWRMGNQSLNIRVSSVLACINNLGLNQPTASSCIWETSGWWTLCHSYDFNGAKLQGQQSHSSQCKYQCLSEGLGTTYWILHSKRGFSLFESMRGHRAFQIHISSSPPTQDQARLSMM